MASVPPLPEGEKGEQHTTHRWIVGITQHNARKLSGKFIKGMLGVPIMLGGCPADRLCHAA